MSGKFVPEDIEQLKQTSGDVFRFGEVRRKRKGGP